jgi:hypothetical protein
VSRLWVTLAFPILFADLNISPGGIQATVRTVSGQRRGDDFLASSTLSAGLEATFVPQQLGADLTIRPMCGS